jgi:hypothetical protein
MAAPYRKPIKTSRKRVVVAFCVMGHRVRINLWLPVAVKWKASILDLGTARVPLTYLQDLSGCNALGSTGVFGRGLHDEGQSLLNQAEIDALRRHNRIAARCVCREA